MSLPPLEWLGPAAWAMITAFTKRLSEITVLTYTDASNRGGAIGRRTRNITSPMSKILKLQSVYAPPLAKAISSPRAGRIGQFDCGSGEATAQILVSKQTHVNTRAAIRAPLTGNSQEEGAGEHMRSKRLMKLIVHTKRFSLPASVCST